MTEIKKIDVKENKILELSTELLNVLLKDNTTNKNIVWNTDNYEHLGIDYISTNNINVYSITGNHGEVIRPRTIKTKKEQQVRIKSKAEVFTPSWICNIQNNLIDNDWFEKKEVFNKELDKSWKTIKNKIIFPESKTWIEYIELKKLEIACGEAPYIVSRYDTVTGDVIDIMDRIGMLDRKFRIINENVNNEKEWYNCVVRAYKSIYGYEWQGDNLLLARENLLYTFRDNYYYKFNKLPSIEQEIEIAEIISWNIWQMDGLKFVVPNSCHNETIIDYTLFGEERTVVECKGCKTNNFKYHNGIYCKIKNWDTNRVVKFINIFSKSGKM